MISDDLSPTFLKSSPSPAKSPSPDSNQSIILMLRFEPGLSTFCVIGFELGPEFVDRSFSLGVDVVGQAGQLNLKRIQNCNF